uniref:Uncharacterized protein n=1 Tax=Anguilla anguilla TaxID=7936 RepID=A0A0E9UB78_ANGAN
MHLSPKLNFGLKPACYLPFTCVHMMFHMIVMATQKVVFLLIFFCVQ